MEHWKRSKRLTTSAGWLTSRSATAVGPAERIGVVRFDRHRLTFSNHQLRGGSRKGSNVSKREWVALVGHLVTFVFNIGRR